MIKRTVLALFFMFAAAAVAGTVFESDGSSMEGWETQWHELEEGVFATPFWQSDGYTISCAPYNNPVDGRILGGSLFNTNAFRLDVGDVAILKMDFEGTGVLTPNRQNHVWLDFGLRTGGKDPWVFGDLASQSAIRCGTGANRPNGFVVWNLVSDAWNPPHPHCDIPSDENYMSDKVTLTYSIARIATGLGPSTIVVSNHVTGVQSEATSYNMQLNENNSAASNLYFYILMHPEFSDSEGFSTVGSSVKISNIRLTVEEGAALGAALPAIEKPAVGKPLVEKILHLKRLSSYQFGELDVSDIEGQVLNIHPNHTWMFIHDGEAGIYVELNKKASAIDGLKLGSKVLIDGIVLGGGYSPFLSASGVKITGWDHVPPTRKLDRILYRSANIDVEWVEVTGRPISMEYVPSYDHYLITMEVFDSIIEVFVPSSDDAYDKMKPYMFQQVRVPGIFGTRANHRLQMTGRLLYVNGFEDFELTQSAYRGAPVDLPIHELLLYWKNSLGLVRTQGTIIGATKDDLYLRGEHGNLKASVFHEADYAPGDVVELTGYVVIQAISPAFQTISISRIDSGNKPEPINIRLDEERIDPNWNYELVSLDAEYLYSTEVFTQRRISPDVNEYTDITQETLWCRAADQIFEAILPVGVHDQGELRPGSLLRLVGICHVSKSKSPQLDQMTESFWLDLSGGEAVTVLEQTTWWTPRRLLWGLIIMLGLSLLFLAWVLALQKTVIRQTNVIGKQIQRQTTLSERQRIARELHDTLEQGLTALSIQLRSLYRKIRKDPESGLSSLETVENMLRVCREESRASIQGLRGGLLEKMDLPAAVRQTLEPRLEDTDIHLKMTVAGNPKRLTLFAEHQLLRMITEAASNAIQHASPEHIETQFIYTDDGLTVVVSDDGVGFNPESDERPGHFGVQGMYERANRLNGSLHIESQAGAGTRVAFTMFFADFVKEDQQV